MTAVQRLMQHAQRGNIRQACTIWNNEVKNTNKDIQTWGYMMKIYIKNKQNENAIHLFNEINASPDMNPNDIIYLNALKASSNMNNKNGLSIIKQINKQIIENNINNIHLFNALITAYSSCKDIVSAQNVFNIISPDIVTYNAMMSGFEQNKLYHKIIDLYQTIKHSPNKNVKLNEISYFIILRAVNELNMIHDIHRDLIGCSFIHNIRIKNALLTAYGKCGDISSAKQIFNEIESKDRDVASYTSMITAYGKCNAINSAQHLFDSLLDSNKNIVTYAAMMKVYEDNKYYDRVIDLYEQVRCNKYVELNDICYLVVLNACCKGGYYDIAKSIQNDLEYKLNNNILIATQLINIYGKSGELDIALELFNNQISDEIKRKDKVVWTSIIQCFGINSRSDLALKLYNKMKNEYGLIADYVTFIILINSCSHCGMIREAKEIFDESILYNKYDEKTYTTIIDCFARNGKLQEAYQLMIKYESDPKYKLDYKIWMALLNGCRNYNNLQIAEKIFDKIKTSKYDEIQNVKLSASRLLKDIYKQNKIDPIDFSDTLKSQMSEVIQALKY